MTRRLAPLVLLVALPLFGYEVQSPLSNGAPVDVIFNITIALKPDE